MKDMTEAMVKLASEKFQDHLLGGLEAASDPLNDEVAGVAGPTLDSETRQEFFSHPESIPMLLEAIRQYVEVEKQHTANLDTMEVVNACLEARKSSVSDGTLNSYATAWKAFARHYPTLPTRPEDIEAYLGKYKNRRSGSDAHTKLKILYTFANDRYGIPNILVHVKKPRFKQKEKLALTLEQSKLVLDSCRTDRELALIHLYLGHGFRLAEACRMNVGDVNDDKIYVRGKTREEYMPLLPETRDLLLKLSSNRKLDEPVFLSQFKKRLSDKQAFNIVKGEENIRDSILKRAELDNGYSTHSLRHTFATLMNEAGCDYDCVQRLMRHSRKQVTQMYLHLTDDHIRAKLEEFSPLRLISSKLGSETVDKLHKVVYCTQFEAKNNPAISIPEILDKMVELGEMAKQVTESLGDNGHREIKLGEILSKVN